MLNKIIPNISLMQKINFYFGLLITFCIPLCKIPVFKKIVPFILALWIITWFLEGNFKNKFRTVNKNILFFLPILFYFLHIIGLAYSYNINSAFFDLQVKLSLLISPVLFFGSNYLYKANYKIILLSFVTGCFIISLIYLSQAFYFYLVNNSNYFFHSNLSIFEHPTYLSMYLAFAIAILFYLLESNKFKTISTLKFLFPFLIVFFSIMIFLLSSKAGIICGFIVLFTIIFLRIIKYRKLFSKILLLTSVVLLFLFALKYNYRFIKVKKAINNTQIKPINKKTTESTAVRILILQSSFELIKDNFLIGVGTGDVKDDLIKKYKAKEIISAENRQLNTHNQFIETFVQLGIIGFIILILLFIIPFIAGIKEKNILLLLFLIIVGFNFLFESMLNRQSGVVFFAFFYSFLVFVKPDTNPSCIKEKYNGVNIRMDTNDTNKEVGSR